jgi:hypothetical protein
MSKIYVDEILPKENARITAPNLQLPAGSVIQVVEGTTSSDNSTSSSTFSATNLSATITPSSSSSKILVQVNGYFYTGTNNSCAFDVFRNGTSITGKTNGFLYHWIESTRGRFPITISSLDSPGSTSALTYTLYFRDITGGGVSFPNQPDTVKTTITVMEIAG